MSHPSKVYKDVTLFMNVLNLMILNHAISSASWKFNIGYRLWLHRLYGLASEAHSYSCICLVGINHHKAGNIWAKKHLRKLEPSLWNGLGMPLCPFGWPDQADWEHTPDKWLSAIRMAASRLSPHGMQSVWALHPPMPFRVTLEQQWPWDCRLITAIATHLWPYCLPKLKVCSNQNDGK